MDKIFKGEKLEKQKVRDDEGKQDKDYTWGDEGSKGKFVSFWNVNTYNKFCIIFLIIYLFNC